MQERDVQGKSLGEGRSGEVFLVEKGDGRAAVKVFKGDTLSNLVHYVFTGAPNPYIWNEDAIRAAYARRKVLAALLPYWFGGKAGVADALDVGWNQATRSWTLSCEYVPGRPVPLVHPYNPFDETLTRLTKGVMKPLQSKLIGAGLDGVVWQAGLGNPVGLNNFLQTRDGRFVLIDAESGVPALFPANPLRLLTFYLPRCVKFRRAMFDDVDTQKLDDYLGREREGLTQAVGEEGYVRLRRHAGDLARHQRQWRALSRLENALGYQVSKGRITPGQAEAYRRRPLKFYGREAGRGLVKLATVLFVSLPLLVWGWLRGINVPRLFVNVWKFVTSQEHRTRIGREYVQNRIAAWESRGQLTPEQAGRLRKQLEDETNEDSSTYITDFGAHVGMKATFQVFELTLLAVLAGAGIIPLSVVALVVLADGLIYRTAYTLYRCATQAVRRRPVAWMALLVGLLPLAGSMAFPAQMIWSARERNDKVARFIVYDLFTRIGGRIPIWGGSDTLTEHAFNRLGRVFARMGQPKEAPAAEPATA